MSAKRKALGRGLSALIPEAAQLPPQPPSPQRRSPDHFLCPIERIRPRRGQPRRYFDEQRLAELAASIKQQGVIQPLVVRASDEDEESYELIAGERRWRAAQKAGVHEVPVVVRRVDDLQAFEMALVENIQREDLNPIEEAEAYQRLVREHGYTQDGLARQLGRDRSTVANSLRLLKLPQVAKDALVSAAISPGHARALLAFDDEKPLREALDRVLARNLSVRETEALVKRLREPKPTQATAASSQSANARELEERLSRVLSTRVKLRVGANNAGRIEISYGSLDELDRLLEVLIQ
jgi:ParB family chromosome partitioning protein